MISSYLDSSDFSFIHVLNRAQLVNDALNLARAGYLDYSVALPVTRYLTRETAYAPWSAAFTGFTYLNTMLASSSGYEDFKVRFAGKPLLGVHCPIIGATFRAVCDSIRRVAVGKLFQL